MLDIVIIKNEIAKFYENLEKEEKLSKPIIHRGGDLIEFTTCYKDIVIVSSLTIDRFYVEINLNGDILRQNSENFDRIYLQRRHMLNNPEMENKDIVNEYIELYQRFKQLIDSAIIIWRKNE